MPSLCVIDTLPLLAVSFPTPHVKYVTSSRVMMLLVVEQILKDVLFLLPCIIAQGLTFLTYNKSKIQCMEGHEKTSSLTL